jgi:hypothetical protein
MSDGWIGNWTPGIGDPTVGGWLTVILYALVAWRSFHVLQRERHRRIVLSFNEKAIWRLMMVGMIALGVNKQLDIQSALTEIGRMFALEQGWYDNRRQVQEAFIFAVLILGLTLLAAIAILVWKSPRPTLWACAGAAGLLVFIGMRAVSFHRMDELLGWRLAGLPLNWVLEMGSLLMIGWNAHRRARMRT